MTDSGEALLCLITGPSGSGKTSLALEVQKRLITDERITETELATSVVVIHQDNYFTKPFLPYKDRTDDSYENSSGIDWNRLVADIESHVMLCSQRLRKDNADTNGFGTENKTSMKKIIIVEGHLLGDAAEILRERFLDDEKILGSPAIGNAYLDARVRVDILAVLLVGCSPATCKQRRLQRRMDRSDDERIQLAEYIDAYVWPSFLTYGVDATKKMKREVGVGDLSGSDSQSLQHSASSSSSFFLEINNSGTSRLSANAGIISKKIEEIVLSDREGGIVR